MNDNIQLGPATHGGRANCQDKEKGPCFLMSAFEQPTRATCFAGPSALGTIIVLL